MRKMLTAGIAALALMASQAAASSDSAVISAGDRVGSPMQGVEKIEGVETGWIILAVVVAGVVVWLLVDDNDNDIPESP